MTYRLANNDIVSCTVTNHNICGALEGSNSVVVAISNVGVTPVVSNASDVKLVPNPNKGEFTVKGTLGTTDDEAVTLEVTDMLGQVIYRSNVVAHGGNLNERIVLNNIANGMYLLNMSSASGNKVFHMVVEQ